MKIDYGKGEKNIEVSIYTLMIYEHEFRRDMIKDLFGKVVVRKEDEDDKEALAVIDYRNVEWTALIRALWACEKTANNKVKSFDEWAGKLSDSEIDLLEIASKLRPEIERRLFRTGAAASE